MIPEIQIIDCTQGSERWKQARLGIPTASNFHCIVTPAGKPCTAEKRNAYMMELIGERISGESTQKFESFAMQRGLELEPKAREAFSLETGLPVDPVGFVIAAGGRWGCSPDGFTADGGGLEIKCPSLVNLIASLDRHAIPDQWYVQGVGCMMICERLPWHFWMYTDVPNVPGLHLQWPQDDKVIAALQVELPRFCDELDDREAAMRTRYAIPPRKVKPLSSFSNDWCPFSSTALPNMEGTNQ